MNEAKTNEAKTNVAVLLEHHGNEEMWTATIPLIEGCIAEGRTPGEATANVQSVLAEFLEEDPDLYEIISQPVQFLLTEIEVSPPVTSTSQ